MRTILKISILASILTLAPGFAQAKDADSSLYEKTTAKKLTPEQMKAFGPQAKKFRYDKRMLNAMQIAQDRARAHSTKSCWRYVKQALLASETIDSYPKTAYAKQAGTELQTSYGFKKINISDPFKAPIGAVLVYGGSGAGHVEIRTAQGFVSDFETPKPSPRPLIGVYVKPKA